MNRKLASLMAALLLLPSATHAQYAREAKPMAIGVWINPRGTVKVETGDCAGNLCGWVVWAAPEAQADARDSGVARLIGTELLRDYHSVGAGRYEGTVYVPDMGRSFFSRIRQQNADTLRISGCILDGLICKSQDWRRV